MSESTTTLRYCAEEEEYEADLLQPQAPHPQAHAESNTESAWWLNYIDERMKAWCAGERDYWRQVLTRVIAEVRERYRPQLSEIYGSFTEGFDTTDMVRARARLEVSAM